MLSIAIVVLPQVFDSALHITCDVLRTAAQLASEQGARIRVHTLTCDGDAVPTASGQRFVPDGALGKTREDVVVIPGIGISTPGPLIDYIRREPAVAQVGAWIRGQHRRGVEIAAACTGTWVVAEAGLLDDHLATTTWHLAPAFRRRYPSIRLEMARMLTIDRGLRSAGAAMAHMDLARSIVGARCSTAVCRQVGALLLLDKRPSQAHYMVVHHRGEVSEDFRRIEIWVRGHLHSPLGLSDLAEAIGLSLRTLARRVKDATGETPLALIQRLRVERAIFLLETTSRSFSEITGAVGYSEPATLRRLIRRQTGRAPSDYRS